jgi:hypothetical protein
MTIRRNANETHVYRTRGGQEYTIGPVRCYVCDCSLISGDYEPTDGAIPSTNEEYRGRLYRSHDYEGSALCDECASMIEQEDALEASREAETCPPTERNLEHV